MLDKRQVRHTTLLSIQLDRAHPQLPGDRGRQWLKCDRARPQLPGDRVRQRLIGDTAHPHLLCIKHLPCPMSDRVRQSCGRVPPQLNGRGTLHRMRDGALPLHIGGRVLLCPMCGRLPPWTLGDRGLPRSEGGRVLLCPMYARVLLCPLGGRVLPRLLGGRVSTPAAAHPLCWNMTQGHIEPGSN